MSAFKIEPLDATFGAVITGLKLAGIDDDIATSIYDAWLEYALLIFPEQDLTKPQQVEFARRFGDLEFDLAALSNVRKDGSIRPNDGTDDVVKVLNGNMGWHMDSTYMELQAKGAVFTAHVVPGDGGETGWADTRDAYDQLDSAMQQKITKLKAFHSLYYSQAKIGHTPEEGGEYSGYGFDGQEAPLRSLVKLHPETKRPALVIGRHAYGIPGMSDSESEELLQYLVDFTCQEPRIYHHKWTTGDAVLWDNRCLLHRGCPWDMKEPRVMYHSRIAGDSITESAG